MREFVQKCNNKRESKKSATTLKLKPDDCFDRVPKKQKIKFTTASMSSSVFIIIAYTSFFSSLLVLALHCDALSYFFFVSINVSEC